MVMIGIQPFEGSACAAGREAPQQQLRRRVAAVVAQYPRRWIRAAEARSLVTSRRIYDGFRQAGRLCAIIRTSRCTLYWRSEEHTSELQSLRHLVCRILLE